MVPIIPSARAAPLDVERTACPSSPAGRRSGRSARGRSRNPEGPVLPRARANQETALSWLAMAIWIETGRPRNLSLVHTNAQSSFETNFDDEAAMKRVGWITFSCVVLTCACGSQGLQQQTDPTQSARQAQSRCMPITTCYNAGATCRTASDGCGGTLHCGSCPSGEVWTNNNCYSATCKPFTCGPNSCGCSGDGCGGTLCCGGCPVGA